jgi:hypothetical protein
MKIKNINIGNLHFLVCFCHVYLRQIHNKSNICGNQDYIVRNIHHVLPKLDEIKYNMANMKENIILGICKTFVNKENCMNNSKVGS